MIEGLAPEAGATPGACVAPRYDLSPCGKPGAIEMIHETGVSYDATNIYAQRAWFCEPHAIALRRMEAERAAASAEAAYRDRFPRRSRASAC